MNGSGGIAGSLGYDGIVNDCFNTGAVNGSSGYAGGIVGWGSSYGGTITNCYNTGTVYSVNSMNAGGIVGDGAYVEVTNCYYLDSCGAAGGGTAKTEEEFNSGEVAWLLQNGQETQTQPKRSGRSPSRQKAKISLCGMRTRMA